jgi:Uma2 family endonuclease
MTSTIVQPTILTAADLAARFGPISLRRICFDPLPGTATEKDVLDWLDRDDKRLFELVDGILVEKDMGFPEAFLATVLSTLLGNHVTARNLGAVVGADGLLRLNPGLIRIPDVSFIVWTKFPNRQVGQDPIPNLVPDLAVEVLSPGNTEQEMDQKLEDYFNAGVLLVWYIDPRQRTVDVYTAVTQVTHLVAADTLDGGTVLPGFALPLSDLFAELDPH